MNRQHRIAISIIGFAFPMYGYAYIFKDYFDLCTNIFILTILCQHIERILKDNDKEYAAVLGVMATSVLYAIVKDILGYGTTYHWFDYVMWIFVPATIIGILLISLANALRGRTK